ncbi:MAG: hypothetical protein QOD61_475 [Solirubrobacteraceae bacterium]|nr:hypothetical protein [Solirubrobacteraceae bacterium]
MKGMRRAILSLLALAGACLGLAGAGPAIAGSRAVVVPRVTGTDLIDGYHRLHRAGLTMSIPERFSLAALCLASPSRQSPAPGTRVPPGTGVTVRGLRCAMASPAGRDRSAVVPDFVGRPASAAVAWAKRAGLYWELGRLPPLRPSRRAELLDSYVVTGQTPHAGSTLSRGTDCSTPTTRCYRLTPLRLTARLR